MISENFIKIYESSFRENWDLPALTDYNEQRTYTYQDMAREIAKKTERNRGPNVYG